MSICGKYSPLRYAIRVNRLSIITKRRKPLCTDNEVQKRKKIWLLQFGPGHRFLNNAFGSMLEMMESGHPSLHT